MKPEQQRIAIAEACGTMQWSYAMRWGYALPEKCAGASVPKYTEDLNAMHDAEKVLIRPNLYAQGGWGMYLRHLSIVTDEQHPIDATAAQRAEAFLRTIGKWEGE